MTEIIEFKPFAWFYIKYMHQPFGIFSIATHSSFEWEENNLVQERNSHIILLAEEKFVFSCNSSVYQYDIIKTKRFPDGNLQIFCEYRTV